MTDPESAAKGQEGGRPPAGRAQRRRLVIDPRFQWRYTGSVVAAVVGVAAFMSALLYYMHCANMRVLTEDPLYAADAQLTNQVFLLYLVVAVCVLGVGIAFWGLTLTHRVSGPIYVMRTYLSDFVNGVYPRVRALRRKDELKDLSAGLADAVRALKARDEAQLGDMRRLLEALEKARQGGSEKEKQVVLDELTAFLRKTCASIEKALGSGREDGKRVAEPD